MVDGPAAEEVTRGKARVAGANNDRSGAFDGLSPQETSTVMLVGFASASNTAERFWD